MSTVLLLTINLPENATSFLPTVFNWAFISYIIIYFKIVLNLQMTYVIIAHTYEQWDR